MIAPTGQNDFGYRTGDRLQRARVTVPVSASSTQNYSGINAPVVK